MQQCSIGVGVEFFGSAQHYVRRQALQELLELGVQAELDKLEVDAAVWDCLHQGVKGCNPCCCLIGLGGAERRGAQGAAQDNCSLQLQGNPCQALESFQEGGVCNRGACKVCPCQNMDPGGLNLDIKVEVFLHGRDQLLGHGKTLRHVSRDVVSKRHHVDSRAALGGTNQNGVLPHCKHGRGPQVALLDSLDSVDCEALSICKVGQLSCVQVMGFQES
jgi:hypothetical protein